MARKAVSRANRRTRVFDFGNSLGFTLIVLSVICSLTPQSVWAADLTNQLGKTKYDGYKLLQRNKMLGLVEISACPKGVRFCSPLINGILVDDHGLKVTVFSDESKKWKQFPAAGFKGKLDHLAGESKGPKIETKTILRNVSDDKPILGLKTRRMDFVLKLLQPPYPEFPDQLFITEDIHTSKATLLLFEQIFGLDESIATAGFPLRWVQTVHLGPTRKAITHDTVKAEKRRFTAADFLPPPSYKRSDLDADVFGFGM